MEMLLLLKDLEMSDICSADGLIVMTSDAAGTSVLGEFLASRWCPISSLGNLLAVWALKPSIVFF